MPTVEQDTWRTYHHHHRVGECVSLTGHRHTCRVMFSIGRGHKSAPRPLRDCSGTRCSTTADTGERQRTWTATTGVWERTDDAQWLYSRVFIVFFFFSYVSFWYSSALAATVTRTLSFPTRSEKDSTQASFVTLLLTTRYWFSCSRIQQLCVGDTRFPARRPRGVPIHRKWKPPDPHPFQPPPGKPPTARTTHPPRITCGPSTYRRTLGTHPLIFLVMLLRNTYLLSSQRYLHHFQNI